MAQDPYYFRSECSNSDLSELNKLLNPEVFSFDYSEALRFGSLLDAMITEPHRINVYKNSLDDEVYKEEDFQKAKAMKLAFYKDNTCNSFMKLADCQKVSAGYVNHTWANFEFKLLMRCRWDMFMPAMKMGADIKTTTATSQKQFEEACAYFSYYRSRVVYMLLENTNSDMLIGISKVNCQIFKIPIKRGDKNWQIGLQQASELAFNYWQLFDNFNSNNHYDRTR